jgi:mRNA-degrading endonuclease RelE of RelBE toxin-antitoxin system
MDRLDSRVKSRISEALDRYLETEIGDVVALKGPLKGEFRLKVGDWRVRFIEFDDTIEIKRVVHRGQAYDVREPFEQYKSSNVIAVGN